VPAVGGRVEIINPWTIMACNGGVRATAVATTSASELPGAGQVSAGPRWEQIVEHAGQQVVRVSSERAGLGHARLRVQSNSVARFCFIMSPT